MNPLFYIIFFAYLMCFVILQTLRQEWFGLSKRLLSICLVICHLTIFGAFLYFIFEYFYLR